jgi:hypothetical protein
LGQAKERNIYETLLYIRCASLASLLNPPISEEDLTGAIVGHFPPKVENVMISANLKTTQDALAFLSNMQVLEITREQVRRSRREYDERHTNTRPPRGRINDSTNPENRDKPQTRNVLKCFAYIFVIGLMMAKLI